MGAAWFEAANERSAYPTPDNAAERPEQTIRRLTTDLRDSQVAHVEVIAECERLMDENKGLREQLVGQRAVVEGARAWRYHDVNGTALFAALVALDGA